MMPRIDSALFLLGSGLLLAGCGSQPKAPAAGTPPERTAPARTSDGHYSAKYHYRVAYPPGTETSSAEGPNAGDEGEFFTVHAAGAEMEGEVSGDPRVGDTGSDARCRQRIQVLQNYDDHDVKPDMAPPFTVTYKSVKPTWYVFSGTRGNTIFYEKGILHDNQMLTLRLRYPAARKEVFNPLAASIAASFEEYMEVTSKAGVMVGEEGEPGLLFLDPLPEEANNEHTTCAIDMKDRPQFAKVTEGQTVTVAGQPEWMEVRKQTEQNAGAYERRIQHCVLKSVRP
jgi:hypothetical protein